MYHLVYAVVVLVAVGTVSHAAPASSLKERLDLLMKKGYFDWIYGAQTTNLPPVTTAIPQQTTSASDDVDLIAILNSGSRMTTQQLCTLAQTFFSPPESIQGKRDLVVNFIYHICLPSATTDDILNIALLLKLLEGDHDEWEEVAEEANDFDDEQQTEGFKETTTLEHSTDVKAEMGSEEEDEEVATTENDQTTAKPNGTTVAAQGQTEGAEQAEDSQGQDQNSAKRRSDLELRELLNLLRAARKHKA